MVAILRGVNAGQQFIVFSQDGDAAVGSSDHRFYTDRAITVWGVVVSAGTAPTGQPLVVDVLLDGATSLWADPADRPSIVAGANEVSVAMPDRPAVAAGHYLTVGIVQVGSVAPGAKVDVRVLYR